MARLQYTEGSDLREVQPFSIGVFRPTTSRVEVCAAPDSAFLRLIGFSVTYTFDQAFTPERQVWLELVDGKDNLVFGGEGSAALTTQGVAPGPPATVSMGIGGLGTQAGVGDGLTFQLFEMGIIDCVIPPGYKYRLANFGFVGTDSASGGNGFYELLDIQSGDSGPPPGSISSKALAYLLNTP